MEGGVKGDAGVGYEWCAPCEHGIGESRLASELELDGIWDNA